MWLNHQDLSWKYTAVFVHDDVNKKSKQNGDVKEVMHNAHKLMAPNVWSHETGILCEMWGTHRSNYKEYYILTHNTVHTARNSYVSAGACCLYIQHTLRIKAAHLTDYRASNPRKLYSLSIFYVGSTDNRLMRYGHCAGHCLLFDIYFTSTVICKLKLQVTIIILTYY